MSDQPKLNITFPISKADWGKPHVMLIPSVGVAFIRNPETDELERRELAPGEVIDLGAGVTLEYGPVSDDEDDDD